MAKFKVGDVVIKRLILHNTLNMVVVEVDESEGIYRLRKISKTGVPYKSTVRYRIDLTDGGFILKSVVDERFKFKIGDMVRLNSNRRIRVMVRKIDIDRGRYGISDHYDTNRVRYIRTISALESRYSGIQKVIW